MAVTPQEFRRMAVNFPGAEARAHMNHPDFRVAGKIFATLGYPNKSFGMVKLTRIEQQMFVNDAPNAFTPCAGKWGLRGATSVNLRAVNKTTLRRALTAAWELASASAVAGSSKSKPTLAAANARKKQSPASANPQRKRTPAAPAPRRSRARNR